MTFRPRYPRKVSQVVTFVGEYEFDHEKLLPTGKCRQMLLLSKDRFWQTRKPTKWAETNSEHTATLRIGVLWGVEFEYALRLGHTHRNQQIHGSVFLRMSNLEIQYWVKPGPETEISDNERFLEVIFEFSMKLCVCGYLCEHIQSTFRKPIGFIKVQKCTRTLIADVVSCLKTLRRRSSSE